MEYGDYCAIWALKLINFWTEILILQRMTAFNEYLACEVCLVFLHELINSSLLPFPRILLLSNPLEVFALKVSVIKTKVTTCCQFSDSYVSHVTKHSCF